MGSDGKRNSGTRQSALWGSGTRGGERRSSALWGRGGRLAAALLVAAFALCAPLAALADPGNGQSKAALVTAARTASPEGIQAVDLRAARPPRAGPGERQPAAARDHPGNRRYGRGCVGVRGKRPARRRDGVEAALADQRRRGRPEGQVDHAARKGPGLVVTLDAPVETAGRLTNSQLWPYVSGNSKLWGSRWQPAPERPDDRDRRLGHRRRQAGLPRTRVPAGEPELRHAGRPGRRGRPRHVRGGDRRGRERRLRGRLAELAHPSDQGDGRQRRGADVGRSRRGAVDPREQGHLQHQGRELLAALGDRHALLLRPARPRGREALAERRRRGRGVRELRHGGRPERRPLLARQRPVRDHRRRGGHRQRLRHPRRLGRALVGVGPHRGRFRQARARRARPLHDRAGLVERAP